MTSPPDTVPLRRDDARTFEKKGTKSWCECHSDPVDIACGIEIGLHLQIFAAVRRR